MSSHVYLHVDLVFHLSGYINCELNTLSGTGYGFPEAVRTRLRVEDGGGVLIGDRIRDCGVRS